MKALPVKPRNVRQQLWDALTYAPVVLCILVMLPRLVSPQFGLLDDGWNLGVAREIAGGDWQAAFDVQAVRFRPLYWLLPGLVYWLAGLTPFWYFACGLVLFAATTAFLIAWVRREGGSRMQAFVTGLLFALSGPAIESYYTILKSEGIQVTWLAASLLVAASSREGKGRLLRVGVIAASTGLLLLAYGSKEPTIVMLPIAAVWWVLAHVGRGGPDHRARLERRSAYLIANLLCLPLIANLAYRFFWLPAEAGLKLRDYGSASVDLLASLLRWAGWLLRDFPYVLPLLVYLGWETVRDRGQKPPPLVWEALIWIGAWVIVYLPWGFTNEFYLLPATLGAAVLSGAVADRLIRGPVAAGRSPRSIRMGTAALAVVGLIITLPNNLTAARVQLTVDQVNAQVVEAIAETLPEGGQLLVALPETSEYLAEIRIHLSELNGRPDLVVRPWADPLTEEIQGSREDVYLLVPWIAGQPYFGVRVGFGEGEAAMGQALLAGLDGTVVPLFRIERSFTRLNVSPPALLCPLIARSAYCAEARLFVERETFSYGWRLYSLPGGAAPVAELAPR
jgi:hypothetical protein